MSVLQAKIEFKYTNAYANLILFAVRIGLNWIIKVVLNWTAEFNFQYNFGIKMWNEHSIVEELRQSSTNTK